MTTPTIVELIDLFGLTPHPEGGYYRETYRSELTLPQHVLPLGFQGDRACSTAIYYLLPRGAKSCLHRIASDEIWHFYLGDPLDLVVFHPSGQVETITLGQGILQGQQLQCLVPAESWFGALPKKDSLFCFVGCTVAPGFDFAEFELASRSELISLFPNHVDLVEQLTTDAGTIAQCQKQP